MVRPRTAFGENDEDVFERLANLRDEAVGKPPRDVPADDTTGHDKAPLGHDAVGIPFRLRPAARLEHLETGRDGFRLSHRTHADFQPS